MRHKWLILGTVSLALVLGLLTFVTLRTPRSPIGMGVDISRSAGAEIVFSVSITNTGSRTIKLNGRVEATYVDEAGHGIAIDYVRLAGSGLANGGLAPKGFDSISLRASDPRIKGVRLRFTYCYDADPLRRSVGRICKRLNIGPRTWPPNACWRWPIQTGLLDGRYHMAYDRTWLAEANLVQSGTFQTSQKLR